MFRRDVVSEEIDQIINMSIKVILQITQNLVLATNLMDVESLPHAFLPAVNLITLKRTHYTTIFIEFFNDQLTVL